MHNSTKILPIGYYIDTPINVVKNHIEPIASILEEPIPTQIVIHNPQIINEETIHNENNEILVLENETYSFFVIMSIILFTILFILFIIYAFNAIITTPPNMINDLCPETYLWYYLLTILIFTFYFMLLGFYILQERDIPPNLKFLNIQFIKITYTGVQIIIICWGYKELFTVNCIYTITDTKLYLVSFCYFVINSMLVILFLGICLFYRIKNITMA